MIKKVFLKYNKGIYDDKSRILLYDFKEKVILQFEGHTPANSKLILALKIGTQATQIEVVDKKVELPKEMVVEGKLMANLTAYVQGEEVANYLIEPLLISKIEHEIEILPEIQYLKRELDDYKLKFENLSKSFKKIVRVVGSVCNIDIVVNEDLTIKGETKWHSFLQVWVMF